MPRSIRSMGTMLAIFICPSAQGSVQFLSRVTGCGAFGEQSPGRAGDGIRTHDVSLGKAAFYH
jgi:hypothetical protein